MLQRRPGPAASRAASFPPRPLLSGAHAASPPPNSFTTLFPQVTYG